MQKIYDISVEISPGMILWDEDSGVIVTRVMDIKKGAEYNLTRIDLCVHNGTHIDSPLHFLENGNPVDTFSLTKLIGSAQVIKISDSIKLITANHLQNAGIHQDTKKLLIKTGNSRYWTENEKIFHRDYAGITTDAAQYVVDCGIELVGIDYLSISPMNELVEPHKLLMRNNIAILETTDLSGVPAGFYDLFCLPLKICGVEGAPVRAILIGK